MAHKIPASLHVQADQPGLAIGEKWIKTGGKSASVRSPIDGELIANVTWAQESDAARAIDAASEAFKSWRNIPAPRRGEFVRRIGEKLRERKHDLALLLQLEVSTLR